MHASCRSTVCCPHSGGAFDIPGAARPADFAGHEFLREFEQQEGSSEQYQHFDNIFEQGRQHGAPPGPGFRPHNGHETQLIEPCLQVCMHQISRIYPFELQETLINSLAQNLMRCTCLIAAYHQSTLYKQARVLQLSMYCTERTFRCHHQVSSHVRFSLFCTWSCQVTCEQKLMSSRQHCMPAVLHGQWKGTGRLPTHAIASAAALSRGPVPTSRP